MTKRIFVVAILAAAIVMIGASVAVAATTSGYTTWNSGTMSGNPHSSYTTTTVKCNVCHAVHKAPAAGQILLRSTAADSCTYCHITNNFGVKVLYGASVNNYSGSDSAYAHNAFTGGAAGDVNSVACVDCHSVHSANAVGGASAEKILKTGAQASIPATYTAATSSKYYQVTAFCTKCHPYFTDTYEGLVNYGVVSANQITAYGAGTQFKSHIMTTDVAAYGNGNGTTTAKVAWAPSDTCRTCHDGGTVNNAGVNANSFPHFGTSPRFLQSAAYAGASAGDATLATEDGVCLKCHKGAANSGVGYGF